jgi:glycosyltransferase 2 family protein
MGALGRASRRLFASRENEPRHRRATDVILLLSSLGGLVLLGALAEPPAGIEQSVMAFVAAIPNGFRGFWALLIFLPALLAVIVIVSAVVRRRWTLLRDLVLAGALSLGGSLLVARIVLGDWPSVWDSLRAAGSSPYFPPLSLSVPAAVVVTASPHLVLPMRRLGRWVVFLALFGNVLHQTSTPTGVAAALLLASGAAAAIHLIFGSSQGRPSLADVAEALARIGVAAQSLSAAERQPTGMFEATALDEQGKPLLIKVFGRDAHDTQLVNVAWRTLWYREAGSPTSFGRLQQAEHEAFLTVMAATAGVCLDEVVTATSTPGNDVLLVLRRAGQPLDAQPDRWTPGLAQQAWHTLETLHRAGIAHGQVDATHLVLHGIDMGLVDFRGAVITPGADRLATDRAQLLVTAALALDMDMALSTAVDALGADALTETLPYVQMPALTVGQRTAVRTTGLDLDRLRSEAAEQARITVPELQRLRRVTLRTALQAVLLVVAFFALAAGLTDIDFDLLAEQVRNATWWLVIAGAIIAQLPRVTSALSVMGASPSSLPLRPVYALQLATSYISLAVPATAARVAVNIRFFQRHGLRPGTALAIGALDGFAQFIVQVLLLLGILLFSPVTLHLDLSGAAPSGLSLLVLAVVLAGVAALITLALVAKWRRAIVKWVRTLLSEALHAVRGLDSPRRLLLLLGGNLATELLFAFALQTFARALGYQVGLAELLLINISVSLLSGVLPVPGGIGVVEGGLTFGLVRAGIPEEAAFAIVLLYRLATFYLPPIWGFFALRWLERTNQL